MEPEEKEVLKKDGNRSPEKISVEEDMRPKSDDVSVVASPDKGDKMLKKQEVKGKKQEVKPKNTVYSC